MSNTKSKDRYEFLLDKIRAALSIKNVTHLDRLLLVSLIVNNNALDTGVTATIEEISSPVCGGLLYHSVHRSLRRLQRFGILKRLSRGCGRNSNSYVIDIEKLMELSNAVSKEDLIRMRLAKQLSKGTILRAEEIPGILIDIRELEMQLKKITNETRKKKNA